MEGIFRGQVWRPPDDPCYPSAGNFERKLGAVDRWRSRLALRHRSTIFPDVYDRLKKLQADVLVTHEAPSAHPNGFKVLDELATKINIHTAFHGRHHDCFNYSPANELPRHLRNLNGNALRRMRQQRSIALNVKLRLKEGLHNPRRSGSRTSIIHTMKPGVRFDRFPGHIAPVFHLFRPQAGVCPHCRRTHPSAP